MQVISATMSTVILLKLFTRLIARLKFEMGKVKHFGLLRGVLYFYGHSLAFKGFPGAPYFEPLFLY